MNYKHFPFIVGMLIGLALGQGVILYKIDRVHVECSK